MFRAGSTRSRTICSEEESPSETFAMPNPQLGFVLRPTQSLNQSSGLFRRSGSALNAQYPVPVLCGARQNNFPPKIPRWASPCRTEADRARAEADIELID